MDKRSILVVSAMEVEAKVLLEKLDNVRENKKFGFSFYEGYIEDKYVVLLVCGVGVINASSGLMVGIMEYNPKCVINYGIAGAMSKDIHTKDIVVGSGVVNINSYRTNKLKEGEGSNPFDWELVTFLAGEEDRYIEYNGSDYLIELTKNIEYKNGNVFYGNIASGDVWNNEIDRMIYLNSKYNTLVEDMESIGVYNLCNKLDIPVISIKIVSDNSLIGEEYNREVGVYLIDYIIEYLVKMKTDN